MSTITKSSSSSSTTCIYSTEEEVDHQLRRGPWTVEEDNLLIHWISSHGEGRWNSLAKQSGLRRTGKSCRLRWLNYLKPDVKRGNLTPQEQLLILELHSKFGNRWSKIAQYLPGRTDNEIKNYWRTRVQKQARHLRIDSNSAVFQEVIRSLWMPRLLQKINGSSPSLEPIQHEISPVPQEVQDQFSLGGSNSTFNLDHQLKNSSSDSTDSSSDQSVNISSTPETTEQPTNDDLFHYAMGQSDYNTIMKGCYNIDNIRFDMETLNQTPGSAMGDFSEPSDDCHVGEGDWSTIEDEMAYGLWNMDESWQLQGSGT